MKNLTILTKYSTQGASSRYRYFLYLCNLLREDVNLEIDSFFDTSYLKKIYSNEKKSFFKISISYIKRFFVVLNSSKNLVIEYEVFPYLPYFIERFFLKNKNYILNFDDNVWENYKNKKLLKSKFDSLVENASGIIVANNFLFNKLKDKNSNIIKIPTVVDLNSYQNETTEKFDKFSIVWIGTPITYKYIKSHSFIFQELAKKIDYQLVIIATKKLENEAINGVNMLFFDWSSKIEVELLKRSHLGVMPLDSDEFSKGKSAFKLIQCISASLPIIASDVGENSKVVLDNENGYLVSTNNEWIDKIYKIYKDKELSKKFSQNSKDIAYNYSIQKYFKEFYVFLDKTFID